MQSKLFARALEIAWRSESEKSNFSEVQQFRALMRSFSSLSQPFRIEEFHGMKHQVVFNGQGSWGRPSARCEISDLLIISYRKFPQFQARATLLQAKKSNEKHPSLCSGLSYSIPYTDFKANLEQWDLLSRRPNVLPFPPFDCHPEILSGAILPSIGSLGVFHRISAKDYGFFYMSADSAEPMSSPKGKHAKLKTKSSNRYRVLNGYRECTYACCLLVFGEALYDLEIGTPIESQNCINEKDERYRNIFRGWLRTVIYSHLEITENDSQLARDLLGQLESDYEYRFMSEPPALLLINSDELEFNKALERTNR
ncbi:hypothetical protein UW989_16090 [Aeromonas caviae]|uniref:hypothetical protein n=1 Tax=Aeromonas caviae TaxID=648 RepID=UPI0029DAC810|nr:hypothetical protein [Aeromonas caviae]MDX7833930.1 hypothetical protein [Aeromonas caviae]MDY7785310.1 hypothetical protein [Aeromonas caviae]